MAQFCRAPSRLLRGLFTARSFATGDTTPFGPFSRIARRHLSGPPYIQTRPSADSSFDHDVDEFNAELEGVFGGGGDEVPSLNDRSGGIQRLIAQQEALHREKDASNAASDSETDMGRAYLEHRAALSARASEGNGADSDPDAVSSAATEEGGRSMGNIRSGSSNEVHVHIHIHHHGGGFGRRPSQESDALPQIHVHVHASDSRSAVGPSEPASVAQGQRR